MASCFQLLHKPIEGSFRDSYQNSRGENISLPGDTGKLLGTKLSQCRIPFKPFGLISPPGVGVGLGVRVVGRAAETCNPKLHTG